MNQSISEVSRQLSQRAEEIARHLLPNGKREGAEWRVGSADGESGKSLAVHLTGAKAGVWADFAAGAGGDLLDLWALVKGCGLGEALRAAKDYLGIESVPVFVGSSTKSYRSPDRPDCRRPVIGSPVMEYLTKQRGIEASTLAVYKVAETDSEIIFPLMRDGELLNVKYLSIDRDAKGKKITRFESGCMLALFGWQAVPDTAREILICEGEIDALSWFQFGIPALSVPNGAKSFTWLENEFEFLERFETINLSWDMDGDGRQGVAEAIDRLGRYRCRVVELPYKDANECLQNNVTAEAMRGYVSNAKSHDPAELKRASYYVEEVIDEFYPPNGKEVGFSSPWSKLDGLLQFRPGEYSVWSGFNKSGKTTILNQIILKGMNEGERACIASLEIKPRKLLRRLTRQLTASRLPLVETIRDAHFWYDGRLWIFDLVGQAKAERLFQVFEYARQRYGIKQFVIDSLMRCGIAGDDYNAQKAISDGCAEFATAHDAHVHLVAHSKKGDDSDMDFSTLDVKGSGDITDLAHNIFGVRRNKKKEKLIEDLAMRHQMIPAELLSEPDAFLICDGTREGEWIGKAGLWFHRDSLLYLQSPDESPRSYLGIEDNHERREEYF